ncbi:DUF5916 domain-containing protein [Robiginitalea sp. SC105]|uniref:DUF5916 domain-containing protein n=1 Tax=Robiginitalea sp. SC105 TaxID=2762332 RepID=UPI001639561A|nr:DUF5916 domain-containing protein [Robiginitalea sp. SC105]MBC2839402.1 carbohydrate binding family 9 domain-containing protein [Robiginitalea sp. SC105]
MAYLKKYIPVFAGMLFLFTSAWSQPGLEDLRTTYGLRIARTEEPIELNGLLGEPAWQNADVATDFWQKFPTDGERAAKRTEVRMAYDDRFLYISAVCYDSDQYVVQTLKRDSRFFDGDGFGVVIDPLNRRTNGFLFGVSPFNVQSEDLLSQNAFGNLNFSWDNRWFSAVTRLDDRWIVEMAIPFKTLRFEAGIDTWGINFFRNDLKENQYHSWTPMPVNFNLVDLGYTGSLVWDKAPEKTGTNVSLIPYVRTSLYRDKEADPVGTDTEFDAGIDAKLALTSSLNLDLTVNPDFSQVDVDVQQTNLTRFSLNFPERRPFFLENNDLFTSFGTPPARPIFTRRIGLDENRMPVPILFGARLSGNLTKRFRLGLLNLQTQAEEGRNGQNYTIATFNQSLLKRSLIKGYVTNRQAVVKGEGLDYDDYGRNAGLEFNYLNLTGSWNVFGGLHLSDKPEIGLGTFRNLAVQHNSRNLDFFVDYFGIDTDYYADIGFIPRLDNYDAANDTIVHLGYEHLFKRVGYTFRPAGDRAVIAHGFSLRNVMDWQPDWTFNERSSSVEYEIQFRNTSAMRASVEDNDTRLLFATRFTGQEPLPPGKYTYSQAAVAYQSDARKPLAYEGEVQVGEFYNGTLNRFSAGLTYRIQPWGNFNFSLEQNYLRLPEPYGSADLTLIGQRSEVNFSNKLFWTTFFQYNTQSDNFNINSRLQWRFAPMSDLFLVYTDNYLSSPFLQVNRNRGVVLKINYWLTL